MKISTFILQIATSISILAFIVCPSMSAQKTTGIIDGYEWVDLGLPSGTLWGTTNVGASHPEEAGEFFAWGKITPQEVYSPEDSLKDQNGLKNIAGNPLYDAATASRGEQWRMPSAAHLLELFENCKSNVDSIGDVKGLRVTGKNGMSIFIPFVGAIDGADHFRKGEMGILWSSDALADEDGRAFAAELSGKRLKSDWYYTYYGCSVRPVVNRQVKLLSVGRLTVKSDPKGASVYLNDSKKGKTNINFNALRTGNYLIRIEAEGYGSYAGNVEIKPNSTTKVNVDLVKAKTSVAGHEYVDLGLPSGTLWATMNIGADSTEAYGKYFMWAETSAVDNIETMADHSLYVGKSVADFTGNPEHDAASVLWGGGWRTPTEKEMAELNDYCKWEWVADKSKETYGFRLTGPNGNSLFLPAAGTLMDYGMCYSSEEGGYWTSTPAGSHNEDPKGLRDGRALFFEGFFVREDEMDGDYEGTGSHAISNTARFYGNTIRPVISPDDISKVASAHNTTVKNYNQGSLTLNYGPEGAEIIYYGVEMPPVEKRRSENTMTLTGLTPGFHQFIVAKEGYRSDTLSVNITMAEPRQTRQGHLIPASVSNPDIIIDGIGYVDLGLPSGRLWAVSNLQANSYYGHGEEIPYCIKDSLVRKGNSLLFSLPLKPDVLSKLGGSKSWKELKSACRFIKMAHHGVEGYFTIGPNYKAIFIPFGSYLLPDVYVKDDKPNIEWQNIGVETNEDEPPANFLIRYSIVP